MHQDLVMELRLGIRLPTPQYCPKPIADLIQTCFKETPAERPPFSDIKESISLAYVALKRESTSKTKIELDDQVSTQYADVRLEETYLDMKKQNEDFKEHGNSCLLQNQSVNLDTASMVASFTNADPGPYASLQNMSSSVTNIMSKEIELTDSVLGVPLTQTNGFRLRNKHLVSPISPGYRRHFSFSAGDDNTPLVRPANDYSRLTSAKSYPNPVYMMNLSNVESVELQGLRG